MNTREQRTAATPGLRASRALGVLLVTITGCVAGTAQDPNERPDALNGWATADTDGGADTDAGDEPQGGPIRNATAVATSVRHDADVEEDEPSDGGCQVGSGDDASYPDKDAGSAPSGGPVPNCSAHLFGDGKVCISYEDVKLKAPALCEAEGMTLSELRPGEQDCPGGSTTNTVVCCETVKAPAPACITDGFGDGTICIDWTALKLKASAACQALNASLTQLWPSEDPSCANGARWAKYECCGVVPPAPQPSAGDKQPWLK